MEEGVLNTEAKNVEGDNQTSSSPKKYGKKSTKPIDVNNRANKRPVGRPRNTLTDDDKHKQIIQKLKKGSIDAINRINNRNYSDILEDRKVVFLGLSFYEKDFVCSYRGKMDMDSKIATLLSEDY